MVTNFFFPKAAIDRRGGKPLISLLPNVSEWPVATTDWDASYGKTTCAYFLLVKYLNYLIYCLPKIETDSTFHLLRYCLDS